MHRPPATFVAETLIWLTAAALLIAVATTFPGLRDTLNVALGALVLAFGVQVFLRHGSAHVTTLGLANAATAMFIGLGGISEGLSPSPSVGAGYVTAAITSAFAVQVGVTLLAWSGFSVGDTGGAVLPVRRSRRIWWIAIAALVGVLAAHQAGIRSGYVDGAAFAAVVLLAVASLFRPHVRLFSFRVMVPLAGLAAYVGLVHGGSGRLRLVALACAIGMLVTSRFPYRWIKFVVVLAAPVAIRWMAQDRLALQESLQSGASEGRTGLESMFLPIRVFARIIEATAVGERTPDLGRTFLSVPFQVLPESSRPEWVPDALGYALVALVAPSRVGTGYSVAATTYGEWYYGFGLVGLLLMVPVLAWLLRTIDRRYRRSVQSLATDRLAGVKLAFWAMLAGGIADVIWSGLHTWAARTAARVPLLLVTVLPLARPGAEVGRDRSEVGRRPTGGSYRRHRPDVVEEATLRAAR